MKKLHVNFMKDLRNHEFVELYNIIIDYIEKQQVDDITINSAFEGVKQHRKKLFDMQKRKRSGYSIVNKELTAVRNEYLISLRLRVKSYLLSHIPAEREAADKIYFVLKTFGKKYYVPTIIPQTTFVSGLEHKLKHNKEFREAILLLGLGDLMKALIDLTIEIMENYNQRIIQNGETKSKRKGVKSAAYRDMKIMADAINFMAVVNLHNEEKMTIIEELINEIDGILKDFSTPMKSRNTKRENRKRVEATVMELINIQQEEPKLLPRGVGDRNSFRHAPGHASWIDAGVVSS